MSMTSSRAYLLRALNEWILDNNCTPYIVVNANVQSVQVPLEYVQDGQIVLNINPASVRHLVMDNEGVSFEARFNGKSQSLYAPIESINAIYAKENGQGMVFGDEPDPAPTDPGEPKGPRGTNIASATEKTDKAGSTRPQLKVIK